jgi:Cu+-exporting ATPase
LFKRPDTTPSSRTKLKRNRARRNRSSNAENAARAREWAQQKQKFLVALTSHDSRFDCRDGRPSFPALERVFDFPGRAYFEWILTTPVIFWAGREFFSGAWNAARHRAADMNTLVAIGTLAAYSYSAAATVAPHWFVVSSDHAAHTGAAHGVYFEVAAIVITLILMGRLLEAARVPRPATRFAR